MNQPPNQASIDYLKQHPETAHQFDETFGAGASAQILQQQEQPAVDVDVQEGAHEDADVTAEVTADPGDAPDVEVSLDPAAEQAAPGGAGSPLESIVGDKVSDRSLSDLITGEKPQPSTVVDMAKGAGNGVLASVDASGDLITDITDSLGIPTVLRLGDDAGNGVIDLVTAEEAKKAGNEDAIFGKFGVANDNIIDAPVTGAGKLTQGVSQFMTSMVGAGKLIKPFQAASKIGTVVRGAATGFLADFAGFDPHADRLSNLIQQFPELANPVTEYLASDPNDSDAEGRLKNALEGILTGAVAAPFVKAMGAIYKSIRAGEKGGAEASAKALQEAMPEVEEAWTKANAEQPDLFPTSQKATKADLDPAAPKVNPEGQAELPLGEPGSGSLIKNNRKEAGVTTRPRPFVDTAALSKSLTRENLQYFDIAADPELGRLFNFDKMESSDIAQDVMKFVTPEVEKIVDRTIQKGTYSFERMQADAARDLGQMVDLGSEVLLGNTARIFRDPKKAVAHLLSAKMTAQSLGREIANKITKIELGTATDQEKAFFVKNLADLVDLQKSLKVAQKTAARMTAAGRISTKDAIDTAGMNAADILDTIKKQGDAGIKQLAAKLKRAEGDPQVILGQIKGSLGRRTWDVVNEVYINSLLSGARTHIANMASNTFNLAYLPAEKMLSGVVTKDAGLVMEGLRIYKGYANASLTALKMAAKSFRMGDNVLDPAMTKVDKAVTNPSQLLRDNARYAIHSTQQTPLGSMIRGFGTFVRMPTRLLAAEDEFFKQLTFRAQLQADLETKAMTMFRGDKEAQRRFIDAEFKKAFDADGRMVVEEGASSEKAMNFSREATFTQDLGQGTWGRSMQNLSAKHPAMRTILPFVRTPVNIMRFTWTRTPGLNLLQKEFRENLLAGGARTQKAMGQMAAGSVLYISALELANRNLITGGGPTDPDEKKRLMDTGWQPYSVQIQGSDGKTHYVSYQRLAPWATFLGMVADIRDMSGSLSDTDAEQIGYGMAIALANNVTNQSFLQGATNFLDAVTEPGTDAKGKMAKFFQKTAAGFVPTGLMQLANMTGVGDDPYMREVNSVLDAMKAKIPGLSKDLPPKRSWLTGQPKKYPEGYLFPDAISPLAERVNDGNVVLNELARLKHNFDPPAKSFGNIELTPKQYDRLLELSGTVKLHGKTLMEALEQEMHKDAYDLKRERVPDAPDEFTDMRTRRLTRIIGKYREKAKQAFLDENEVIKAQVKQDKRAQAKVYRGDVQSAQDFLDSLK